MTKIKIKKNAIVLIKRTKHFIRNTLVVQKNINFNYIIIYVFKFKNTIV